MASESNLIFERYQLITELSLSRGNIARLTKRFKITDMQAKLLITRFNEYVNRLHNKDIFNYNTVRDVLDAIEAARITPSHAERKALIKTEGAQKVFENDKCIVLRIRSPEAAMIYGRGTKWCIAALYDNQFGNYTVSDILQNTVYFILNKQKPGNKYAVLISGPTATNDSEETEETVDEIRDETNENLAFTSKFYGMHNSSQILDTVRGELQIPASIFQWVRYTDKEREAVKRVGSMVNQRELEQHLNRLFNVAPR